MNINIKDDELRENLHDESSPFNDVGEQKKPISLYEIEFQFSTFITFVGYMIVISLFGPLSYFVLFMYIKNGACLAKNFKVFHVLQIAIWVIKMFCYITTLIRSLNPNPDQNGSMSQFWLLIYTDISLIVLYAGYYSSLTKEEMEKFKTEVIDNADNAFDKLTALMERNKARISAPDFLNSMFPALDPLNFFLIYPKSEERSIPMELKPMPLEQVAPHLKQIGVNKGVAVRAEKFVSLLLERSGYKHFDIQIKTIKVISRLLIFIRVILPVINNLYQLVEETIPSQYLGRFILYLFQQVFYSILIYRFVTVFDLLFLGITLYWKKFRVLSELGSAIKLRSITHRLEHEEFRINCSVPHNARVWLNIRRVLSSLNAQVFLVVDTNMSFILLYSLVFVAISILQGVPVLSALINKIQDFLYENPSLLIVLAFTVLIVMIVILADVTMGILINRLFILHRGSWMQQNEVIGEIQTKYEIFLELLDSEKAIKEDARYKRLCEIRELLDHEFLDEAPQYLKKLRKSIKLTLDGIKSEEKCNPHTLLGLKTTIPIVATVSTVASGMLITVLAQIIGVLQSGNN